MSISPVIMGVLAAMLPASISGFPGLDDGIGYGADPLVHFVDVIGTEDRFNIDSEMGYFSDVGGLLTMKFGSETSTCTGYLIGKEWVVTASHCVLNLETGEAAREITFDPGLRGFNSFTYPREYATEFFLLNDVSDMVEAGRAIGWSGLSLDYLAKDFAIVHIPSLKGRRPPTGYPLHLQVARSPEDTVYMQTAGYPSDKDAGSFWFAHCTGDLDPQYDIFNTSCDAAPGQSGSAVVQIWSPKELEGIEGAVPNKPVLIGVVSATNSRETIVSAFTQKQIDEIHGLIGKTDHHHASFRRYKVERQIEHRLFVVNTCDRDIDVFSQRYVKKNGETSRILDGRQVPANGRAQLLSTTFAAVDILFQPSETGNVRLYRESHPSDPRTPVGPARSIYLESRDKQIDGFSFELGTVWTDARLVIECMN